MKKSFLIANLFLVKDCSGYLESGDDKSGVRSIDAFQKGESILTYCDQETEDGGWTTILNRDASEDHEDFNRNYADYEHGFGDRNGEFWLGLQTIHQLTTFPCTELRIDMDSLCGQVLNLYSWISR